MPPYLSVVVTARNDDHGGNLLHRMQAFVNGLLGQCQRHQLPAELVIVEWNPPGDRPRLAEALRWSRTRMGEDFCEVRIIEVPHGLHRRFAHWHALPLYQMIAKNIGIRRASGQFIVATNIDILFSDELMQFIAEGRLEKGKMYRIDRYDVMEDVPVDAPIEDQLAYCRSHLIRVNVREGTFRTEANGLRSLEPNDIAMPNGALALDSGWFPREFLGEEPFRWVDNDATILIQPSADPDRMLVLDAEPGPGVQLEPFVLELRDEAGQPVSSVLVKRRSVVALQAPASATHLVPVQLHAYGGGTKIPSDPRTLNFRVFRCEVARASRVEKLIATLEARSAAARTPRSWAWRAGRGLHLMRDVWRKRRNGHIRLPMSGRQAETRSRTHEAVLSPGLSALWASGWYAAEFFAGEHFRWSDSSSTLILLAPVNVESTLTLLVESGPALGFAPFELHVRDQWGSILATARVAGRTEVQVPVPKVKGAFVISLRAHGGGASKKIRGDSRSMAFRIFRCEWAPNTGNPDSRDMRAPALPFEIGSAGSGIWCVSGWTVILGRNGKRTLAASREAEIIVRVPKSSTRHPILEVAPGPAAGDMPFDLVIEHAEDRVLHRSRVTGRQAVHIPCALLPGHHYALRMRLEGAAADKNGSEQALLLLSAITWVTEQGGDPIRVPVDTAPGVEAAPVHLHTNACGDFTLMAREHWIDLRGYPELDLFSMNIDSLFCWAAHHGGAREHVLKDPMRIYHIEHGTGSGWTPEGQEKLFERIAARGLPWLGYEDVMQWARVMNRFDVPMIFNHDDWGMAAEELTETLPLAKAQRAMAHTGPTVRP